MHATKIVFYCTLVLTASIRGYNIELGCYEDSGSSASSEETSDILRLQVIARYAYYIPHNTQHNKAALLDHRHNISALYDGTTGDAFVINYEEGKAVCIPGGVSDQTWNVKKKSYKKYFKNPVPPPELFSIGLKLGIRFDPEYVPDEMAAKMSAVLTTMSLDYSSKCAALATVLHISKITSDSLKTQLLNWENVIGDVNVEGRGDLKWMVGLNQGLSTFFVPFGSADVLNEYNVRLDCGKILSQKGGIYVLCYLIETLSLRFYVGKIIGQMMSSELEFFILINKLGGDILYGYDGLINVLTGITMYNNNLISIETLGINLIRYITDPRGSSKGLERKWKSGLQFLLVTIKKYELEYDLQGLVERLNDMIRGKWKQNGVDMSAVLKMLLEIELPGKPESAAGILLLLKKKW